MKQDLRVMKTQESLRNALLTLLKTKALDSISVAELCRLAKVNRGTFYSHYKDVHGVFKHYLEVIVEDFKKAYEEPYYRTGFRIQYIRPEMIKIFDHVNRYKSFYQIIFHQKIPMMYYYLLFDTVRKFMYESLENNHINPELEVQMDYLISYQANAILGLIMEWNRQDYATPTEELSKQLITILSINSPFRNKE
ncbi:TetR-like C-terminal domain-containing protein [Ornithinibacillus halotolerans]|uniref:TetR family transcriptional regulator n=1 Tax=Ornithinibacillus halotolerans TaxID=1274357 RepID=A0A916S1A9_9BACI|nr:TetR-like C-terminal domain-containing protein [Ornithinibacillus halotolerans]GGA79976.1 TetR family transcriptional regulator [Ornithinibacillus halotolerans]